MKKEPKEVSPKKVLAQVASAVPNTVHQNIIVIGSLAAGYGLFKDRDAYGVRTKDVDCVLSPHRWRDLSAHAGDGIKALLASPEDLQQAAEICNRGLLYLCPVTADQLRTIALRLLDIIAEGLHDRMQATSTKAGHNMTSHRIGAGT
jgi:hypothetical protein